MFFDSHFGISATLDDRANMIYDWSKGGWVKAGLIDGCGIGNVASPAELNI